MRCVDTGNMDAKEMEGSSYLKVVIMTAISDARRDRERERADMNRSCARRKANKTPGEDTEVR